MHDIQGYGYKGCNGIKQRVEENNNKTFVEKEVKMEAAGLDDIYKVDH